MRVVRLCSFSFICRYIWFAWVFCHTHFIWSLLQWKDLRHSWQRHRDNYKWSPWAWGTYPIDKCSPQRTPWAAAATNQTPKDRMIFDDPIWMDSATWIPACDCITLFLTALPCISGVQLVVRCWCAIHTAMWYSLEFHKGFIWTAFILETASDCLAARYWPWTSTVDAVLWREIP